MKRRFGPSLYFASDKVIFDSLNQHMVGIGLIRELLNERGIFVSSFTTKEELAKYFSRLTADYFDHRSIASKLGRISVRERMTYSELKGKIQHNDIIEALKVLQVRLAEVENSLAIDVMSDGRITALISYDHVDYTKIELRQVEPRDAIIEFSRDGTGNLIVRSTQNSEIDPLVDQLLGSLKMAIGGELERSRINLQSIVDPKLRTLFFESLMKNIVGYDFLTVTQAYCFKPKEADSLDSEEEIDEGTVELEKSTYVERVSLRGEGVNRSFVIDDLYKKGYYIVKVVWRVKPKASIDSDIFELEAQFTEPKSCTEFSYRVKTIIICEDGIQTGKRRSPTLAEDDALIRLVENAAKIALEDLKNK